MKRLLDVILGVAGLLLAAPMFLLLCIVVRVTLGSPIFFSQPRPGLGGRPFSLVKFRTMTDGRDAAGDLLPDEERLTRLGSFLRSMSLDELPELWAVLKGEMSLVGPRPLLLEYLPIYTTTHARRHNVRPGLTGWAQINGRNALSWEEKLDLDVWYVDNQSLSLDLIILLRTIATVSRRRGISAPGESTMTRLDRVRYTNRRE